MPEGEETDYSHAIHDEPESAEIEVDVVKPLDEVMEEHGKSYPMHMKMQIGTGETHDGTEFTMSHNMGGGVSIQFEDGPRVDYNLQPLARTAVRAVQEAGYDIDTDLDEDGEE